MFAPKPEIESIAVINSGHITVGDCELIVDGVFPGKCADDSSYFVYAGNSDVPVDDDAEENGYSPYFCRLLRLANLNYCCYIVFDSGAPMIEGLPMVTK